MVRSLVMGFGAATMLAAVGSMTPAGQFFLGAKHAAAAPSTAAMVVQDKPAGVRHVVAAKPVPTARPKAHRATAVRRTQPAAPVPSAQALNLTQLLPVLLSSQASTASPLGGLLGGGGSSTSPLSPLAGMLGGGSPVPNLLEQVMSPTPTAGPAPAPPSVQASSPEPPAQPGSVRAVREE